MKNHKVTEYTDKREENRMNVKVQTNFRKKPYVTYASTQGYTDKRDMRTAGINSSIALLQCLAPQYLTEAAKNL